MESQSFSASVLGSLAVCVCPTGPAGVASGPAGVASGSAGVGAAGVASGSAGVGAAGVASALLVLALQVLYQVLLALQVLHQDLLVPQVLHQVMRWRVVLGCPFTNACPFLQTAQCITQGDFDSCVEYTGAGSVSHVNPFTTRCICFSFSLTRKCIMFTWMV